MGNVRIFQSALNNVRYVAAGQPLSKREWDALSELKQAKLQALAHAGAALTAQGWKTFLEERP